MCLNRISQLWLKTKIIWPGTILTTFETLSPKWTEKKWHQDELTRCQLNGQSAAKGKFSFYVTMTVQFPAAYWLWSTLHKSLFIFQRCDICSMKWVVHLFIDWIRIAHSLCDVVIENHFTCLLITFYWSWIYYFQLSLVQNYCQHLLCFWLNPLPSYMTNFFSLSTKWRDLHFGTQCPCQYKKCKLVSIRYLSHYSPFFTPNRNLTKEIILIEVCTCRSKRLSWTWIF